METWVEEREWELAEEDDDKPILEDIKMVTEKWRLVIKYLELTKL